MSEKQLMHLKKVMQEAFLAYGYLWRADKVLMGLFVTVCAFL